MSRIFILNYKLIRSLSSSNSTVEFTIFRKIGILKIITCELWKKYYFRNYPELLSQNFQKRKIRFAKYCMKLLQRRRKN